MILIYVLGIITCINAAVVPLTDLLPPDFPDSTPQIPETSARLRGLYVPDNLEKRFDDGSDKAPPVPVPIAPSPYGPVPAGSGLEGQYVADNLEKKFDDGSDKSSQAPVPLVPSPYGTVPAGSGLEGQYVFDNIEKKFDDGSDKSPPAPVALVDSPYGSVPAGSGLEGQYVPDNLEKTYDLGLYTPDNVENQFDDGSDKENTPEPILVDSPFGLVRVGSGIEGRYLDEHIERQFDDGQYTSDHLEKQFDDGLYKEGTSTAFEGVTEQKYGDGKQLQASYGSFKSPSTSVSNNLPHHGLIQAGVGLVPS